MGNGFISNDERLSFREIVLSHLKRILEISSNEFRGGYYNEQIHGSYVSKEYVPDSRACYIQSVDSLFDVLLPHFDETMKNDSKEYLEERNKEYEKILKEWNAITDKPDWSGYWNAHKLPFSRQLFQKLNLLLNRKQYLKSAVYSEEDLEDD